MFRLLESLNKYKEIMDVKRIFIIFNITFNWKLCITSKETLYRLIICHFRSTQYKVRNIRSYTVFQKYFYIKKTIMHVEYELY